MNNLQELKVTGFEEMQILLLKLTDKSADGGEITTCYALTTDMVTDYRYINRAWENFKKYVNIFNQNNITNYLSKSFDIDLFNIYGIHFKDLENINRILDNGPDYITSSEFMDFLVMKKYDLDTTTYGIIKDLMVFKDDLSYSEIFMTYLIRLHEDWSYKKIIFDNDLEFVMKES